ncbi:MAG TPA: glycosyltransferase [Lacipirellulaceae bacterium]|nr:glycosyltransferase [Lacipirellulaceae bacterium]
MKIAMFTNTYLPHVGGVARSVSTYEDELRSRGHEVRVVAPTFEGAHDSTDQVLRVSAIQGFNGSDFSVRIPQPGLIASYLDEFRPDVIHSHHPFLLGDAALRYAWARRLPLAFTHHTLYEQYTHYVPLDSAALKRVAVQMAVEYCNLCTHVIAPSESLAALLAERGVTAPVTVIPTGIDLDFYSSGDRRRFLAEHQIPEDALVIGHVGRLAGEKNLAFLARAVRQYLARHADAVFVVVGDGNECEAFRQALLSDTESRQVHLVGKRTGSALADAYASMDVFVFSSQSETQGMVLAEAMAAGAPVVALDGPGVRDVVARDNGRLLPADSTEDQFSQALEELTSDPRRLRRLCKTAQASVQEFSIANCADRLERLYEQLAAASPRGEGELTPWDRLLGRLEIEWNLLAEKASALAAAVAASEPTRQTP